MILLVLMVCVTWFLSGVLVALAVGQAARKQPDPRPDDQAAHLLARKAYLDSLER